MSVTNLLGLKLRCCEFKIRSTIIAKLVFSKQVLTTSGLYFKNILAIVSEDRN